MPKSDQIAAAMIVAWLFVVPLSTAVTEVVLAIGVLAALAARGRRWRDLVTGGPHTRLVPRLWLAFVALILVSTAAGVDPAASARKLPKLFRYALVFLPLTIPLRAWFWRAIVWVHVPLSLVLLVLGVASLAAGHDRAQTANLHYNTLAQVAATSSLFLLAGALYGPPGARRERAALVALSLVAAGVMVITDSRAAWFAWWLIAVGLVLMRLRRRTALLTAAGLALVPLIALPWLLSQRPDLFDLRHPEFARRYDMWRMAAAAIADHPLTGLGPGGLDAVYDQYRTGVLVDDPQVWNHVHNDVLGVALDHGVVAAAIWVALIVIAAMATVRRLAERRGRPGSWLVAGFAAAGASLLLFQLFGVVHDNQPIYVKACTMLLLWGLLVAADRDLGAAGPASVGAEPRG